MNILQSIFSVKNERRDIFKIKVFTILGVKMKFKNIDKEKLQKFLDKKALLIKSQKAAINDLKATCKDLKIICKDLEKRTVTNYKVINAISSPSKCPPARGELRQCQLAELEIMKVVKKLCDENNLSYWLDGGTLLGAVRHKGFVPWDGDVDICILRDDYLKLIPLLQDYYKNSDEIYVRELLKCKRNWMNYQIRIRNKGEKSFYGVDIFPIDNYYKGNITEEEQAEAHKRIKEATHVMQDYMKQHEDIAMDIDKARECIKNTQDEIILEGNPMSNDKPALFTGIDFAWVSPTYFIVNWDKVFPLKTIEFEGVMFNCPNDLHYYMTNYYRNYMLFPSKITSWEDRIDDYIKSITMREE